MAAGSRRLRPVTRSGAAGSPRDRRQTATTTTTARHQAKKTASAAPSIRTAAWDSTGVRSTRTGATVSSTNPWLPVPSSAASSERKLATAAVVSRRAWASLGAFALIEMIGVTSSTLTSTTFGA